MEKKKIIEIEMNSMHELNSAYANAITRIEDRYLSSKIEEMEGHPRVIKVRGYLSE